MKIINKILKIVLVFIVSILILSIALFGYSKYIEPRLLTVKNYEINENKDRSTQDIKIVQFTDTQLGDFYKLSQLEDVVEKINKQNPDIVVFTGDLIDKMSKYEEKEKVSNILSKINAKLGKFAIWGNHDYGGGGHKYYDNIMERAGFKVLVNETIEIALNNNQSLSISGLDEAMFGSPDSELLIKNMKKSEFNLLLLHEPDLIDEFKNSNVNLALAGHSHGGQVAIPFIGSIITPPIAKKYTKGFYDIEKDIKLYVNTGLGNTKMPYRFMNIPQISVFNISI